MKKTIIALAVLLVSAGCSEYLPPVLEVKLQESGGAPVKIELENSEEQPLNVSVGTEPMRVVIDSNALPVSLDGEALSVKVDNTAPLVIKMDTNDFLWPAAITAGVILILTLSSLISAFAAVLLAKTATKALKKMKGKG